MLTLDLFVVANVVVDYATFNEVLTFKLAYHLVYVTVNWYRRNSGYYTHP